MNYQEDWRRKIVLLRIQAEEDIGI